MKRKAATLLLRRVFPGLLSKEWREKNTMRCKIEGSALVETPHRVDDLAGSDAASRDLESHGRELVAGNIVEETLPDGRKVQGAVVHRTDDLYCVDVGHELHKGVKRSDLHVIR